VITREGGLQAPLADRRSLLMFTLTLGGLAMLGGPAASQITDDGATAAPAFPLAVVPGLRHLVDAAGTPFLIHGDTAWSLIADLVREDVDLYLDDRRARAFNTILVNLIENRFSTNPPANAYGEEPFLAPEDYTSPNEAYFAHADWVLRRAAQKGFLVLLTPSYAGYGGGAEGWYGAMPANGPDRLRQYGGYLGQRYRDFPNILWVHAGDYDPPEKDLVRAIVEGIQEFAPGGLHTAHGAPDTAVADYWRGEAWLQVNNVYTYGPVHGPALEAYARPGAMPFFLIESAYENEHEASERRLRTQAYQAVLSGAAGQIFGNNPIWHFNGPGTFASPVTWKRALDSRGARSMTHLHELLTAMPWWELEPDIHHTLLTDGLGPEDERAVAARAADGSFAILYLPSSRAVTVDLARLAGPEVAARWYDPSDGKVSDLAGSPFPATGPRQFGPEAGGNASGFDDWLLILESQP
jgi:Protein of unknown function (DUF4038)/Putative collagen-binding domain of a collagenase